MRTTSERRCAASSTAFDLLDLQALSLHGSIMISFPLGLGRNEFGPAVVRVRTAKSAVASYHLLHAHFVGRQTAIVEIALTSDRAPRHLSGLADTKVEQHCHRYGHYDEHELHGSSPIGQLALNVRSEAVPPISSEINARRFTARYPVLPTKRIAHLSTSGDRPGAGFRSGLCRLGVNLDTFGRGDANHSCPLCLQERPRRWVAAKRRDVP